MDVMQRIVAQHVAQANEKTGRVKTENKTMEGHVSLDVCCEATNCKYNENNNCIAKHINVKPSKNKDFGSTECASFELR